MTTSRNLNSNLELNPTNELNGAMEQNPFKKMELKSVKGTDTKLNFMIKKVFILIALFAITASVSAQLKVDSYGLVTINAQTQDWWPAIRTYVPTKSSCAYNLWSRYLNKDVFFVCAEGYLWTLKGGYFGSDIALKRNITPIEGSLKKVLSLQGVKFQYKDEIENEATEKKDKFNDDFRIGFIAQEVEKVFPEVVKEMPDGTKAMTYTDLIAVLVEAIKEQQTQIENMQTMVNTCCQRGIDYSPSKIPNESNRQEEIPDENSVKKSLKVENDMQEVENSAKLFQNVPNPFSENTEIKFEIPENMISAKLLVHDMQGGEIRSYSIVQKGLGTIIINGFDLHAGMYMYTLLVNNRIVDTKKMILTK
jgi:hypothetical protein